jgi:hypothetical protein
VEDYTLIVDDITSEDNAYSESTLIKVFPNPVDKILNVDIPDGYNSMMLFDISGKQIFTKKVYPGINKIDLSNVKAGVYLLKISGTENTRMIKVVKE